MFCALVLAEDAKNYHVWSHRQHIVRACSLWEQELAFTATAIAADVRNNSAWNQRVFCLLGSSQGGLLPPDLISRELAFARTYMLSAPNNEAVWAYVGGLAAHAVVPDADGVPSRVAALATDSQYETIIEEVCAVVYHAHHHSLALHRHWRSTHTVCLHTRCWQRCTRHRQRCSTLLVTQFRPLRRAGMQWGCSRCCSASTRCAEGTGAAWQQLYPKHFMMSSSLKVACLLGLASV